jgi:hypoxanthine phosphoribosyltransferase
MYIKKSGLELLPDWVDREAWKSYQAEALDSRGIYRALDGIDKHFADPVTRRIFGAKKELSWDDIEEMVVTLGSRIKESYSPGALVGIEKGGALYVRRLAQELDIDPQDPSKVGKIKIAHYRHPASRRLITQLPFFFAPARVEGGCAVVSKDKNLLLVDDDVATGKTIACGKEYFMENGAQDVRSAILCGNQSRLSKATRKLLWGEEPDYYAATEAYGIYPWYMLKKNSF